MITSANGKIETPSSEVKVCGCCLGSNSSDANEIVECDGCGISVHEVNHNRHNESDDLAMIPILIINFSPKIIT